MTGDFDKAMKQADEFLRKVTILLGEAGPVLAALYTAREMNKMEMARAEIKLAKVRTEAMRLNEAAEKANTGER